MPGEDPKEIEVKPSADSPTETKPDADQGHSVAHWALYGGGGLLAFAAVLESLTKVFSVVTPRVTYVGSVLVLAFAGYVAWQIKAAAKKGKPAPVVLGNKWKGREFAAIGGILFLLWIPRWLPAVIGLPDGPHQGQNQQSVIYPSDWPTVSTVSGDLPEGVGEFLPQGYNPSDAHYFAKKAGTVGNGVRVNYYLVSDQLFLAAMYDPESKPGELDGQGRFVYDKEFVQGKLEDEENMVKALFGNGQLTVMQTEPFRFQKAFYAKFLVDRYRNGATGKSSVPATALAAKPDSGEIKQTNQEGLELTWLKLSNAQLAKGGWVKLDPLLEMLVSENLGETQPFAKAGVARAEIFQDEGGCGDGVPYKPPRYSENAFVIPRRVKVLFADFQNLGSTPIDNLVFNIRSHLPQNPNKTLRESALSQAFSRAQAQALRYPKVTLQAGEHVLIPLGLLLCEYDDDTEYVPAGSIENLWLGPAVELESASFIRDSQQVSEQIRKFISRDLAFLGFGKHGDYEGASCPYLYLRKPGDTEWLKQKPVITGADSPSKAMTERRELPFCDGTVKISEEEFETSYLDEVALEGYRDGKWVRLPTPNPLLAKADHRYMVLRKGESVVLSFPEYSSWYRRVRLVVSGHYVPDRPATARR